MKFLVACCHRSCSQQAHKQELRNQFTELGSSRVLKQKMWVRGSYCLSNKYSLVSFDSTSNQFTLVLIQKLEKDQSSFRICCRSQIRWRQEENRTDRGIGASNRYVQQPQVRGSIEVIRDEPGLEDPRLTYLLVRVVNDFLVPGGKLNYSFYYWGRVVPESTMMVGLTFPLLNQIFCLYMKPLGQRLRPGRLKLCSIGLIQYLGGNCGKQDSQVITIGGQATTRRQGTGQGTDRQVTTNVTRQ